MTLEIGDATQGAVGVFAKALEAVRPIPEIRIDLKSISPSFAELVLETVGRAGIDESRVVLLVSDASSLEYLKKRHPSVRFACKRGVPESRPTRLARSAIVFR